MRRLVQSRRSRVLGPRPDWLSLSAYGRRYSVDRKTVAKWVVEGRLDVFRAGGVVRVSNQPPKARKL
jgi:hypothetical protein